MQSALDGALKKHGSIFVENTVMIHGSKNKDGASQCKLTRITVRSTLTSWSEIRLFLNRLLSKLWQLSLTNQMVIHCKCICIVTPETRLFVLIRNVISYYKSWSMFINFTSFSIGFHKRYNAAGREQESFPLHPCTRLSCSSCRLISQELKQ